MKRFDLRRDAHSEQTITQHKHFTTPKEIQP
jgi:hypothetical protein